AIGFHIVEVQDKKKEDGVDLLQLRQIFVAMYTFADWLGKKKKEMRVWVPVDEFIWNKETGTVDFRDAEMQTFEKDERANRLINSLGNAFHYLGFGFTTGYQQKVTEDNKNTTEISGYASGCSLIIKREVLDKIGCYDEEYYMYHDDLELSWRAKLAGYKIVLAHKSIIYHKYEFKRSVLMLYYMERNRFLAIFTYYRLGTIALIMPALIFLEGGMWLYAIAKGWFKTKTKVAWYFLQPKSWQHIIKARKEVKQFRIVSDKTMLKSFKGRVEFQEIDNVLLKYIGNPILNTYLNLIKKLIIW
ncbi:MAG: hypothetical protein UT02_C0054G0005, partial [Parcubacteria group bacterium GW2011_GWC2_38_7]